MPQKLSVHFLLSLAQRLFSTSIVFTLIDKSWPSTLSLLAHVARQSAHKSCATPYVTAASGPPQRPHLKKHAVDPCHITMALPAHDTKHLSSLSYPFLEHTFALAQRADGVSNGTALWLGAQCLSAFLVDSLPAPTPNANASTGSGTGSARNASARSRSDNDARCSALSCIAATRQLTLFHD